MKDSKALREMAAQLEYMAREMEEIEQIKPMLKNHISNIHGTLKELKQYATLERANFSSISPDLEINPYPSNEKEVDAFIKTRISLWFRSWIVGPIDALLEKGQWGK